MHAQPKTALGRLINEIEESLIAIILGLMTVITFTNVIARYVFSSNILWALETTSFLFAWLVMLGASYCIKITSHLGVDAVLNLFNPAGRRILALISVAACLAFSILLLIGSWNYWAPFVGKQAFYEVEDIYMPSFLQFLSDWLNEGEKYEKLPRFIPYFVMPLGMALITLRFVQAGIKVWNGEVDRIIASHEAEDLVEEAAAKNAAAERGA